MSTGRNTTIRDRHRKTIAQDEPPCGICGQPIDYQAPYLDPRSYVVDHIIPVKHGGPDTLDNKQASHRACNRDKSDKLDAVDTTVTRQFETTRTW